MKKNISVLGSTGSIGTQTLDVASHLGIKVCAISGNRNITLLENQIRKFKPEIVAVKEEKYANELKITKQNIISCLKKKNNQKYAGGFRWEYKNPIDTSK